MRINKFMLMLTIAASMLVTGRVTSAFALSLVNGLGGSAGFGGNFLARNDDGSTGPVSLSSVFPSGLNFFGNNYTSAYFNNNGNITFNLPLGTYTPFALIGPTGNPIIAPYFADVDTRGGAVSPSPGGNSTGSNLLWWDLDTANKILTLTWDDVGYYGSHTDKLNAFQLALINRDNINSGDFDIEFRYESIEWTTGDASGGSGGLGGTVARAGWNSGNGTDFFELTQSGNQSAMLDLKNASNVNTPGLFRFQVRSGQVIPPPSNNVIPEPATLSLLGLGLMGLVGLRSKTKV